MKKILSLITILYMCISVYAQSPDLISYQAVVRDASGNLVTETNIQMEISIIQGIILGEDVYIEIHKTSTNINGLISIEIGAGVPVSSDFSTIDWSDGPYFIKTGIDLNGGAKYTITGTNQILSVPYALHSKTADNLAGGETDPVFSNSVAYGITGSDTTNWNNKSDFDGDFSSLYNAPNIANSVNAKTIQLNTNNNTSSLEITKNNGSNVFKVDGSGKMTGDGSGLSNVKPLINYIGGNQRFQVTANYGTYNNVRTVTLTVPAYGICYATASGYVDWESTGWDLYLGAILMDEDPNSSWTAENHWYSYLNIITDYNCADSSDQYTCFSQQRCFPVTAGTHTFTLWVNKYSSASKTELGDVNLSVMYFPTGGTGKLEDVIEPGNNYIDPKNINPNSVNGEN